MISFKEWFAVDGSMFRTDRSDVWTERINDEMIILRLRFDSKMREKRTKIHHETPSFSKKVIVDTSIW